MKLYYSLDPELSDGQNRMVTDTEQSVAEALKNWLLSAEDGDEVVIRARAMTREQFESLPDL